MNGLPVGVSTYNYMSQSYRNLRSAFDDRKIIISPVFIIFFTIKARNVIIRYNFHLDAILQITLFVYYKYEADPKPRMVFTVMW